MNSKCSNTESCPPNQDCCNGKCMPKCPCAASGTIYPIWNGRNSECRCVCPNKSNQTLILYKFHEN
jgi:hypothetical protein